MNERLCGDKFCFSTSLKEDLNILAQSQNKIVELLTEQKSITAQLNGLKEEFNRYRNVQDALNSSISVKIEDINEKMVTSRDMKIYLTLLGVIIATLSLFFKVFV